jgi:ribosomal protein S5
VPTWGTAALSFGSFSNPSIRSNWRETEKRQAACKKPTSREARLSTMADEVKTNAEALVPRFRMERVLNQGRRAALKAIYLVGSSEGRDCRQD